MASIDKRPNGTWRARWREFPNGPQRSQHFAKKSAAEQHLTAIRHDLATGRYVTPKTGRITVADCADEWKARRHWRPSTADRVERELRRHIIPELGSRPLASLRRAHIEEWAAALPLARSSVETVHQTLSAMLASAVEDERLARNPATGARLPKVEGAPFVPMTAADAKALSLETVEHSRAAVLLGAGSGLRQGELFGLTRDRVDFMRKTLRVDRQLWTGPGLLDLAPPKSANSYRTVALSPLIVDALAAHLAAFGSGADGLCFHIDGRPVSRAMGGKYIRAAATSAGLEGRTWHDLRHYHASVLLSAGVSPALVAERLGHDVATLLKTYAQVIRADEDRVRAIVDDTLGGTAEDFLRTKAV